MTLSTSFWKASALVGMSLLFVAPIAGLLSVAELSAIENDVKGTEVDTTNVEEKEPVTNNYFVFLYSRGPGWLDGKPVLEQPFINDHFAYMGGLEKNGALIIGGPYKDESGVMGVLKAGSLEEAQGLIDDDPLIRNRVFSAVVKGWHPAVPGCIE